MTIVQLRQMQNALAARFMAIDEQLVILMNMKVRFDKVLYEQAVMAFNEMNSGREFPSDEEPYEKAEKLIGTEIPVICDEFLFPLIREEPHTSNILHGFESLAMKSAYGIKPVVLEFESVSSEIPVPAPVGWGDISLREPSSLHWLKDELETIKRSYRAKLNKATTGMRDLNTSWKGLAKAEARMPGFMKSSLLGMFGGADLVNFEYSEADFKWQPHGQKPKIMSARYLAPFIGIVRAAAFEAAFKRIGEISAPLPGEPPTIDYYGSHVSNKINIFGGEGDDDEKRNE